MFCTVYLHLTRLLYINCVNVTVENVALVGKYGARCGVQVEVCRSISGLYCTCDYALITRQMHLKQFMCTNDYKVGLLGQGAMIARGSYGHIMAMLEEPSSMHLKQFM